MSFFQVLGESRQAFSDLEPLESMFSPPACEVRLKTQGRMGSGPRGAPFPRF